MKNQLNIGIIGAGGFALFAAKAFLQIHGIKIICVFDADKEAADDMAAALNATPCIDANNFFSNADIHLVYIATPPFLHYEQSKMALLSEKHVICEKPAALKIEQAEELRALARSMNKLYVVNLMQRYNLLYTIVKNIIDRKMMGNFLHGFFENYASDENLNIGHWFWDVEKSGGIFIEHGVHFFDIFSGWFGQGKIMNSLQLKRPGISPTIIDRVQASALYDHATVNFYHGFNQPKILDRQEMRLQFEKGDITLFGWVPVKMKLHGLLLKEDMIALKKMLNNFSSSIETGVSSSTKKVHGMFNDIIYDEEVEIEYGHLDEKPNRYIEILKLMLQDQWNWIEDRDHVRVVTDANAVDSLIMAVAATEMAQKYAAQWL